MVDVLLKNYAGEDVTYKGVNKIKLNTTDGNTQIYTLGESTEITEELNLENGDQEIIPPSGYMFSKVTVKKPETLLPENIALGINIAGVIGSAEMGSGIDFDFEDESLKFFAYNIDFESKIISLYSVLYDKIFEKTGSYDVTIPEKIGGYTVLIGCT